MAVQASHWLDERLYPGVARNWDDELLRTRVLGHLQSSSTLLDLGAGAGIVPHMNFRGIAGRVCGIDLDPRVTQNPYLDEGRQASGESVPYPDDSFDVVVCDNVLEHLEQPAAVFREVHRVLKPGGVFLAKTPNKHHYMPLIARLTPHRFHQFVNRLRGRAREDTFPTRYRANTRSAIRSLARATGFEVAALETFEGRPEYLRFSTGTYLLGFLYERLVNGCRVLAGLRVVLIAEIRKPLPRA